jgi:hypothetical protein
MHFLAVEIVKFVDAHQPGFVECQLVDAENHRHSLIDKVPICSFEDLDASSAYPRAGSLQCKVLARWKDDGGRELVRVSLAPDGVESTEGLSEFVVLGDQLTFASPA